MGQGQEKMGRAMGRKGGKGVWERVGRGKSCWVAKGRDRAVEKGCEGEHKDYDEGK